MNGNRNIIEIIEEVVSKMTPFVTVSSITANGDNWRLNTCNTYWITVDSQIIIDEVSYTVIDLVQNSYIEIESTTEPTVSEFQLEAPEFWHSSSRKVSNERSQKNDVRKPFVYLPVPRITEDKAVDSDKAYDADIRPIFLTNFNPQRDTIELQQTQIIEPLNAMANFFLYLIKEDISNFDDFDSVDRREWMNFGNETVWGNDKKIFKENLSGVELFSFSLPVLINENCGCESDTKICADSSVYTNSQFYSFAESGGDLNIDIQYENGTPIGENIDGVWTIPDPIPLVCDPAEIKINSNEFATVNSGDTLNIEIEYQTSLTNPIASIVGNKVLITDPIVIPTNKIYIRPHPTGEIYIPDNAFYPDYCDSWRVFTGQDISTQPTSGIPMLVDKSKRWKLAHTDNDFGNRIRLTGLSGGYYDFDLLNFYNESGSIVTYAEAFPFDYFIDHSTGLGGMTKANASNMAWATALNEINSLSYAGFDGYFMANVEEHCSIVDLGFATPLGTGATANPIFSLSTNGNKWTSTTVKGLETRAWVIQPNGDLANNILKTGVGRYMAFRYHFNNS